MGKGEWVVFTDPDGDPHIVIKDPNERIPNKEECERACRILNEEGSSVIRLSCRNEACKDFGGWIERGRKDAEKNVFHCQICGKAMER